MLKQNTVDITWEKIINLIVQKQQIVEEVIIVGAR